MSQSVIVLTCALAAVATAQFGPFGTTGQRGRPTANPQHRTRPGGFTRPAGRPTPGSGSGASGFGCATQCPVGQVCGFNRSNTNCHRGGAMDDCFACQTPAFTRPPTPPGATPCRGFKCGSGSGSGKPYPTRPVGTMSCSHWVGASASPPKDSASCYDFCSEHESNATFTAATGTSDGTCCCQIASIGKSRCCEVTVNPSAAPVSTCAIGGDTYNLCSPGVLSVATRCAVEVGNARDCNPLAPTNSSAFADCEAIYDCVQRTWRIEHDSAGAPDYGTCCPCIVAYGESVPNDQWMDHLDCPISPTAIAGQDDDDQNDITNDTP
eukprot:m.11552 g.11552  ORF g.11552 m.11552 type:complete len:323 (-) comp8776_c0_seq1:150-1118(-)